VTATIGASGLAFVSISARLYNAASDTISYMSVSVDGAAASDADSIHGKLGSTTYAVLQRSTLVTGLSAGNHTFAAKYKVSGNTGTWVQRRLTVIPL
jgi:hypothetical protein